MSDVQTLSPRRHRGPAPRRHIVVDGVEYLPRDELSKEVGISARTGARIFKNVRYIANISYVPKEESLRTLVGLNQPQQPKPRTAARGPYRKARG
jgi:hypothetical protein